MALRDRRLAAARIAVTLALVVLHTWPLVLAPHRLTRHDNADALLNEWIVAWVAHQAPRAPLALFDANIFYPERRTLAFSEHLVVPAAMAAPLQWAGVSPVLSYNLLIIAGFALSAWAMWVMVERWTGSALAGFTAGSLYAFNAHTLTRLPHVQALHLEFLPFAWLALDRVLISRRWRDAWLLGVFAALQALTSNYLLVFTGLALGLSVIVRPEIWQRRWTPAVVPRVGFAAGIGALLVLPFLLPYAAAQREQGLTRSLEEVALYSSTWRDYLATPGWLHFTVWSHQGFDGATALFPGFVALILAGLALGPGRGWRDPRGRMVLATGLAGVVLSFGPSVPGYAWLYHAVPLLQGVRGAARFGFLGLVAAAVLAGYGVAWLQSRTTNTRWTWVAVVAALLVHVEAWRGPITYRPFDGFSPVYDTIARDTGAVVAEFPFFPVEGVFRNASYMLNSTRHWRPLVNGYSGFTPASYVDNARAFSGFPDERSRVRMTALGVTHVVVHLDAYGGRRAEKLAALAATPWLRLAATDGHIRVYRTRD